MCGTPVGVDNTSRRKFDKEEYLERARQREQREKDEAWKGKERGPPVQRQPLKHRDYEVDLDSRLGKTQAGYYCSVCECVVKDSANYLDHINGKKHQRALGMSMRVERASLEQVQKRFEALKKRKDPSAFTEQVGRSISTKTKLRTVLAVTRSRKQQRRIRRGRRGGGVAGGKLRPVQDAGVAARERGHG
ncbi:uncharacterized protein [Miscanthus floridulus]|uniref:uncharacterized protein isoform X1 n=1 Tax=Miscanthus floridulus TaxID=154761 RepID=UPI003457D43D